MTSHVYIQPAVSPETKDIEFWFANYWDHTNNLATYQENLNQFIRWCYDVYGVPGPRMYTDEIRWVNDIAHGYVRLFREEDVTLMMLRWV